jgi:ribosomal protein L11 methyltransferase
MAHLKLCFESPAADCAVIEDLLFAAGANSVAYFDAGDAPIHEPAPGESPLWPEIRVEALYAADADPLLIEAVLRSGIACLPDLRFSRLEDRAWEREWLRDFRCMRFGERLWVCPDGQRPEVEDAVVLDLDPGLAFGTGTHPTTALCLEWLSSAPCAGRHVIDYGCGSGILAIAALKLGARHATAIDIDPQARLATVANAARNGVADRLSVEDADYRPEVVADALLANILAGPLIELAVEFAAVVRPGGPIVLSGLLDSQAREIGPRYEPWFELESTVTRDGWARLTGRRTHAVAGTGELPPC